jgi:hypothetical protein
MFLIAMQTQLISSLIQKAISDQKINVSSALSWATGRDVLQEANLQTPAERNPTFVLALWVLVVSCVAEATGMINEF